MKKTVSFLVSGRGSNFHAVAKAIMKGTIPAKMGVVISDTEGVRALDIAQELSIPSFFINPKQYKSRQEHEKAMVQLLGEYNTDVVVTAGYMRLLTPYFVHEFKNKIINIHPALLPKYGGKGMYGEHVHKAVLAAGEKVSGATVHFVTAGVDEGEIIIQKEFKIEKGDQVDDLQRKVGEVEKEIMIDAILKLEGRS